MRPWGKSRSWVRIETGGCSHRRGSHWYKREQHTPQRDLGLLDRHGERDPAERYQRRQCDRDLCDNHGRVDAPIMIAGEEVKWVRVAASYGGDSTFTYITNSGREVVAM